MTVRIVSSKIPKHKSAKFVLCNGEFVAKPYGHDGQNAHLLKQAIELYNQTGKMPEEFIKL